MPNSPMLAAGTVDWTFEDIAEELEHLATIEDLESPAGPSLTDLPALLVDDEIARVAEDLAEVAMLEAR